MIVQHGSTLQLSMSTSASGITVAMLKENDKGGTETAESALCDDEKDRVRQENKSMKDVLTFSVGIVIAKLPLLNIRPDVDLVRKGRSWLRVKIPVRVRNLQPLAQTLHTIILPPLHPLSTAGSKKLTAPGLIFPSTPSILYPFVLSISITPSTTTCATCTPFGPNSLPKLCASALRANFPVAKLEHRALPFIDAVAPVKMSVGGYSGVEEVEEVEARRRGRTAREKR